jgi:hypothetical protein
MEGNIMLAISPSLRRSWIIGLLPATCLLILLSWGSSDTWARSTTPDEATSVVQGWLSLEATPLGARIGNKVKEVKTYKSEAGADLYFVVSLNPSGFVIVPADDLVEPIIAFLPEGTFDPSPLNPLGALVSQDVPGRVLSAKETEAQSLTTEALPQNLQDRQSKWNLLKNRGAAPENLNSSSSQDYGVSVISDVRVAPLVQSKWDQYNVGSTYCYNYFTPNHDYCGCVATAMSQLMRFWQHPTSGVGTTSFPITINVTDSLGHILSTTSRSESLRGGNGTGGPYNWGNSMPLVPSSSTTDDQRQAIGALTHDAGVSVNMIYSNTGSGADTNEAADAFRSVFMYSNAKKGYNSGSNLPPTQRDNMVNPNLDAGYPIIFGITGAGGHAIVCDGYGYTIGTEYHHLNMGWSGYDDAWYNLPNINTTNYTFTSVYKCIYNVYVTGSGEIISGRTLTSTNLPISGVTITATRSAGGTYTATTNPQGIYALPKIPSGSSYIITATKTGHTFTSRTVSTGTSTDMTTTTGNLWGINFIDGSPPPPPLTLNTVLDNNNLVFTNGGNANWFGETDTFIYGGSAAQSGLITDSQSSSFQTTVVGPGNVTFYWQVSSEEGWDYLRVFLDGVQQDQISGEVNWTLKTITLPAGSHTIQWSYQKDGSVSEGSDCGWVDKIVAPAQKKSSALPAILRLLLPD